MPNPPTDYGTNIYEGLEPDEEWRNNVMIARMLIKENLSIFSPTTMRLMDLWDREYSHELLVELPDPLNNTPIHFKSFVNAQKERIDKVKKLLSENWKDSSLKIIEEGRTNSELDKEQVPVF